jgi:hypothetical protein
MLFLKYLLLCSFGVFTILKLGFKMCSEMCSCIVVTNHCVNVIYLLFYFLSYVVLMWGRSCLTCPIVISLQLWMKQNNNNNNNVLGYVQSPSNLLFYVKYEQHKN